MKTKKHKYGPIVLAGIFSSMSALEAVKPGDDLQAILDSGSDLALEPGLVYPVKETLKYKADGQKIFTRDAKGIESFATLRLVDKENPQLIHCHAMDDIVLENVVLDGNRYELSHMPADHPKKWAPLVMFGGPGSNRQTIRNCVLMSPRTWSTVKLHEGATGLVARNNIIIGAGTGPRGNGRDLRETAFDWGDGITCAAVGSIIENNLVLDPTDVGVVVFGAPGTKVGGNVIATISRESLGGINMVDALGLYEIEGKENHFSYKGTVIEDNWMDAFGGRIHIAVPMGASPWVPNNAHKILSGAVVRNNLLTGDAAAYGFVAHGVDDFVIEGNKTEAKFSGLGDGLNRENRPVEPEGFLYDSRTIGSSKLQDEFKKADGKLEHLLRCNHGPQDATGYRVYPYGEHELRAVVRVAFLEILAREPSEEEAKYWEGYVADTKINSDTLRRSLMTTPEFVKLHGGVNPNELQPFRVDLWWALFAKALEGKNPSEMDSSEVYRKAKELLSDGDLRKTLRSEAAGG